MLLHQQGCRGNHGDLFAILHRFEGCPNGDLGFSKAHIACHQTVHRNGSLHIRFHLVDGGELVGCFHKRKRLLQLPLPRSIGREAIPRCGHSSRIELHQIHGNLAHRFARTTLGGGPVGAAHLRQGGAIAPNVVIELRELVGRNIEPIGRPTAFAGSKFQHHKFPEALNRCPATGGNLSLH